MPYKFDFYVNNDSIFSCNLESEQCEFIKDNEQRCKNKRTIGSDVCWCHLKYKYHLTIKKSGLPNAGKGLFAIDMNKPFYSTVFKKGDKIIEYKGEQITNQEFDDRYLEHTAPYAVKINKNLYEDCACERGVGSLANTYPNHNNATLSVYKKKAFIKATKNIRNKEEIFLSYGRSYKLNEKGVKHDTKYVRKV
jgi:hypothetical protein